MKTNLRFGAHRQPNWLNAYLIEKCFQHKTHKILRG
jgi:hypothetical protein